MTVVKIPVRDFALPVPRIGSIEVNSGYDLLPTGQEVHSMTQRQRRAQFINYKSEMKLEAKFEREEFIFHVGGRIDSFYNLCPPVIEEMKTTFNVPQLEARLQDVPDHPYRLQLRTYGYFYLLEHKVEAKLRLNLISISDPTKMFYFDLELCREDYEKWLDKRLDELVQEWRLRVADIERRKTEAKKLAFPFSQLRLGQAELTEFIEKELENDKPLMVQAPTGLGKTAAVILPTLKHAMSGGQKLVYVTPKNSQHSAAEDVFKRLQDNGSDVKLLTMTAKGKICLKPEPICTPEYCEYARDYYKKTYENNLVEKLAQERTLSKDVFTEYGKRYQVCPFELQVDVQHKVDAFVGDYNYVFSPKSLLSRLTADDGITSEKPVLVVDEAHNLAGRATEYYCSQISSQTLVEARAHAGTLPIDLAINGQVLFSDAAALVRKSLSPNENDALVAPIPEEFQKQEEALKDYFRSYMEHAPVGQNDPIVSACRQWSDFVEGLSREEERFFRVAKRYGGDVVVRVVCCDAAPELESVYKHFSRVVAFSATLKPFTYYCLVSGLDPREVRTAEFHSPFPENNRKMMIIPQVSTQYRDRNKNYGKISEIVEKITSLKNGNYIVFFPSYEFLNAMIPLMNIPGFNVLAQRPQMSQRDVDSFLRELRSGLPTVILAVQGGVLSEGVDYPGKMLIGAFVVGPALPHFNLERETVRAYFDRRYGDGFDFAYTYPAMTRAVQSAGRVIRSETDRGLMIFIDRRFVLERYARAMPTDWYKNNATELVSKSILKDIRDFWDPVDEKNSSHMACEVQ